MVDYVKKQAMALLPTLIQNSKADIEKAIVTGMQKMSPTQKQIFSSNLNEINTIVQRESTTAAVPAPMTTSAPGAAGKRKRTRKLKHRKH